MVREEKILSTAVNNKIRVYDPSKRKIKTAAVQWCIKTGVLRHFFVIYTGTGSYNIRLRLKRGGIFMRQNSDETPGNMISMEEYLKRRQAVAPPAARRQTKGADEPETALKLAELLYV